MKAVLTYHKKLKAEGKYDVETIEKMINRKFGLTFHNTIDHGKIKVGYEIPFNRHFYEYEAPRPLDQIEADIIGLSKRSWPC